jgi:hypothetical protein
MGIFVLGFGVDGVNSYINLLRDSPLLYASMNWLRLLTGTLFGMSVGVYLAAAFQQATWKEYDNRPALGTLRQLALLVVIGGLLDGAILSGNPLLLYPLAVAAAGGVLTMLALAYTMLWMLIFKWGNTFESWRGLWFSLTSGFMTALVQVIVVDVIRMALTGTWAGFSI